MKQQIAVYKGLGGYGTLGLEIVLSILAGLFGGRWLDGKFDTAPWLMWIGFGLGVGAGIRAVQRMVRLMKSETAREEKAEGNPEPTYLTENERSAIDKDKAWEEDAAKARAQTENDSK